MACASLSYFLCLVSLLMLAIGTSQVLCRPLDEQNMLTKHEEWMDQHGRIYKDMDEKERRYMIFKKNVEWIEAFNKGLDQKYTLNVNKLADLTNEEYRAMLNGYNMQPPEVPHTSLKATSFRYGNVTDVPPSIDWRQKGAGTLIKDQGSCGCFWAFSAVAAVEGINQLKTGNLTSLSEQELVDCDTKDQGCEGGLILNNAFQFVLQNSGLTTEANYPFEGVGGTCNPKKTADHSATITGYEDVPANDEKALLQALANQPVSVAIDAGEDAFRFYSSGIFTGNCGTSLDHGVTAVGYGIDTNGTKYWLVKNSWGTGWGEGGYIRMQRDIDAKEGLCGVAMKASYPTA